jgi:hypothetical protein
MPGFASYPEEIQCSYHEAGRTGSKARSGRRLTANSHEYEIPVQPPLIVEITSLLSYIMKMFRIIIQTCICVAALHLASPAQTAPVPSWKKTLPSECYFVGSAGDSIICVGKNIFVLSRDGALLSQSQPLEDTKSITNNPPVFFLANDRSIVMMKSRCMVIKISLAGQILWTKSYCDSIPNAVFNGYREDGENNAYLYGTVDYHSGLIVKTGSGGTVIYKADTTLPSFTSMAIVKDTLFAASKLNQGLSTTGSVAAFDIKLNFLKRVIDTGCGSPMVVDGGHVVTLNMLDGPSLFKRKFSSTSDIILKKYSMSGKLDTIATFDFGKYEHPLSLQKYRGGFLMITHSDETVNMGTNYWNYFITKLDPFLKKQWQIRFGTDTLGLGTNGTHYRSFFADEQGTILAIHNDTLFKFKDGSSTIKKDPSIQKPKRRIGSESLVKAFDCQGRMLFEFPAINGADAGYGKRSGLKLIRPEGGPVRMEFDF